MFEIFKLKNSKKGAIEQLMSLVVGLVAIGVTLVVAFLIMSNVRANATVAADTNATAAINQVINASATIPTWLPIIVITVIGALLLGLVAYFRGNQ